MNSYFEQSGFYGQGGAASAPDYRFSIGLGGLGGVSAAYGQHQPPPRAPQDPVSAVGYEAPGSPSKSSLYSSLSGGGDPSPYRHGVKVVLLVVGRGGRRRLSKPVYLFHIRILGTATKRSITQRFWHFT
jgi:hypothetical protein